MGGKDAGRFVRGMKGALSETSILVSVNDARTLTSDAIARVAMDKTGEQVL